MASQTQPRGAAMNSIRASRRPSPDAYDYLWSLLPLHITFFCLFCMFANSVR
jgi:hypothetical protein